VLPPIVNSTNTISKIPIHELGSKHLAKNSAKLRGIGSPNTPPPKQKIRRKKQKETLSSSYLLLFSKF